jgi:hypothetical protein
MGRLASAPRVTSFVSAQASLLHRSKYPQHTQSLSHANPLLPGFCVFSFYIVVGHALLILPSSHITMDFQTVFITKHNGTSAQSVSSTPSIIKQAS